MQEEIRAQVQKEAAVKEAVQQENKISRHICKMLLHNHSTDEIKASLCQEFGFSEKEAEEAYRKLTE